MPADQGKESNDSDINYLCRSYKPGYRLRRKLEEESPDSTEQCTGEEPGNARALTDSATENDCLSLSSLVERAG